MASSRAALTMVSPFISAAQPARALIARASPKLTTSISTPPTLRLLSRQQQLLPNHSSSRSPFLRTIQKKYLSSSTRLLHESQSQSQRPSPPQTQTQGETDSTRPSDRPSYELRFTCKPCNHRSSHIISKQGYHHGSVLISCPSCRNRHIISDHLKIFGDKAVTIEDILREKGQLIKKGTLAEDEDVEFWEDGTVTERRADLSEGEKERLDKYARDKKAGLTGDLDGQAPGSTFKSVRPGEKKDGEGQGEA